MSIQSLPSYNVTIQPVQPRPVEPSFSENSVVQGLIALLAALGPMLARLSQQNPMVPNAASNSLGNALSPGQTYGSSAGSGTYGAPGVSEVPGALSPSFAGQPMNADRATQILSADFDNLKGADGMVGRQELEDAIADPNTSQEVKQAARFLLDNPGAFRKLETADSASRREGTFGKGYRADGRISKGDIGAALQDTVQTADERSVAATLLEHKNSLLAGDGLLSVQEMGQIAAGKMPDGSVPPPDVRAAVQKLLADPAMFNKLEDGYLVANPKLDKNGSRGDGKLGLDDLLTALRK